jgi:hypothetical protein
MLVYSSTPPRVAPMRFQPNRFSGTARPRNTMLKIRFAKKTGANTSTLPSTKRRGRLVTRSSTPRGTTRVRRQEPMRSA